MTTQIFERVSGDDGPPVVDTLYGVDDLAPAFQIRTYLYRRHLPTVTITAVTWDVDSRQITVDLGSFLPTAIPGDWKMKHRVTWLDGDDWTWEPGSADVLRVGRNPAL